MRAHLQQVRQASPAQTPWAAALLSSRTQRRKLRVVWLMRHLRLLTAVQQQQQQLLLARLRPRLLGCRGQCRQPQLPTLSYSLQLVQPGLGGHRPQPLAGAPCR